MLREPIHPKPVVIYTDGSTLITNPSNHGGWAFYMFWNRHEFIQSGRVSSEIASVTNNQMELQAAIEALSALKKPSNVVLYSDSQYLVNGARKWSKRWSENKWRGVKNPELWQALLAAAAPHNMSWRWIKGHSGDELNDQVDHWAGLAAQGHPNSYRRRIA